MILFYVQQHKAGSLNMILATKLPSLPIDDGFCLSHVSTYNNNTNILPAATYWSPTEQVTIFLIYKCNLQQVNY